MFESLCKGCFHEIGPVETCLLCGFALADYQAPNMGISAGTLLGGRYLLGKVLAWSENEVTYLSYDVKLEIPLSVKECFPKAVVTRHADGITVCIRGEWGRTDFGECIMRFLAEARLRAQRDNDSGIVSVIDFFEENETAYMAEMLPAGRSSHILPEPALSCKASSSGRVTLKSAFSGQDSQTVLMCAETIGKMKIKVGTHRNMAPVIKVGTYRNMVPVIIVCVVVSILVLFIVQRGMIEKTNGSGFVQDSVPSGVTSWGRDLNEVIVFKDPNLEKELRGIRNITSKEVVVRNFYGLLELDLSGKDIHDIDPLAYLFSLQSLYLNDNIISDLSPLNQMKMLRYLEMQRCGLISIESLRNCRFLDELKLDVNRITDLSPMLQMRTLCKLSLCDNPVVDISGLENLQFLTTLNLYKTKVSNLSPLAHLDELNWLCLADTRIKSLEPLRGKVKLKYLDLSDTPVTDISALANLPNLECLRLDNLRIKDLSAIATLKNLKELYLGDMKIADFEPIRKIYGQLVSTDVRLP